MTIVIRQRHLINPTPIDIGYMKMAVVQADKSPCDRIGNGCVIVDANGECYFGYSKPFDEFGLCGGTICLRNKMPRQKELYGQGEHLEIGCHRAEMIALQSFNDTTTCDRATLYLFGGKGVTPPCPASMKPLIHAGVRRMWLAGFHNIQYHCKPEIPASWYRLIEYGVIPFKDVEGG